MKFFIGKHQKKFLVMLLHYMMVILKFSLQMMVKMINHQVIMNIYGYVGIILILFINYLQHNDLKQIQMLTIQYQLMKYENKITKNNFKVY
jgi:succinate-acetate transporter protein